jgi:agmatinase
MAWTAYTPGTGASEAGGLSTRELLELIHAVFARLPIRALDIVEAAPPPDCNDVTPFAAAKIIYKVFGWVKVKMTQTTRTQSIN